MHTSLRIPAAALKAAADVLKGYCPAYEDPMALKRALSAGLAARQGTGTPTAPSDELLSPKQVAAKLGVSRRTIFNYMDSGLLPRVRVSKRTVRIPRSALLALIAQEDATNPEEAA